MYGLKDKFMTPPQEPGQGILAEASGTPSAVLFCIMAMETLKNRPDFLRAAQARRHGAGSFLLQARARGDASDVVRVGFTASKKIGNAVARNRAKRRLREIARKVLPVLAHPGWDYVLVARPEATIARLFADLIVDMENAMRMVHKDRVK